MPTIKISQLYPVGSELFQDSESFLTELDDGELDVTGGAVQTVSITISPTIYPYPTYPTYPTYPLSTPRTITPASRPVYTIAPVV